MIRTIKLTLYGKPLKYKPPRVYSLSTFNPLYLEKKLIQKEIREQYDGDIIAVPVSVYYRCSFKVPKSFSKKKRQQALAGDIYPTNGNDTSNLVKFYDDTLIDTVIKDDGLIVHERIHKFYGEFDWTEIFIEEISLTPHD